MKVYEFERLQIWGMVISESTEHRLIINKYASEGYRYVGYIPVVRTSVNYQQVCF